MSEILTAPDRGPPPFDWRAHAEYLATERHQLRIALAELVNHLPLFLRSFTWQVDRQRLCKALGHMSS